MKLSNALILILSLIYSTYSFSQIGALDPSFGTGGRVTTLIDSSCSIAAMMIQADGKIVVTGNYSASGRAFLLVRYNTDGSIDNTFGTNGIVRSSVGTSCHSNAIAIQQDGHILVSGYADTSVMLVRYNANGSFDNTFGSGGIVLSSGSALTNDQGNAVAIQNDGKILVATYKFSIIRYNTNGSLDNLFASGGIKTINFSTFTNAYCLNIQSDGNILAGGSAFSGSYGGYFLSVKLDINGSLISSYGTNGFDTAILIYDDEVTGLYTLPNGEILMAGNSGFSIAKTDSSGHVDTTFGSNGTLRSGYTRSLNNSMAIQSNNKIILAGHELDSAMTSYFKIFSLDLNGHYLDSASTTFFSGQSCAATCVAIQTDGKIVAAGNTSNSTGTSSEFALARYQPTLSGIDKVENPEQLYKVYPNPVHSIFTLEYTLAESSHLSITLNDIEGRKIQEIKTNEWETDGFHHELISISPNVAIGTYFMKINCETGSRVVKVVVE